VVATVIPGVSLPYAAENKNKAYSANQKLGLEFGTISCNGQVRSCEVWIGLSIKKNNRFIDQLGIALGSEKDKKWQIDYELMLPKEVVCVFWPII
jgi:hypothetical protein